MQMGPAGRALEDAQAILVPAKSDERIWDYFATSGIPDEQQVERILDALGDSVQSLAGLEAATGMRRGRLERLLKILAVDDSGATRVRRLGRDQQAVVRLHACASWMV